MFTCNDPRFATLVMVSRSFGSSAANKSGTRSFKSRPRLFTLRTSNVALPPVNTQVWLAKPVIDFMALSLGTHVQ